MIEYRVCLNSQPHFADYWTVEKSRRGLFGRVKWTTAQMYIGGLSSLTRTFKTEAEARAWVAEDKKPRTHVCKPA